LASIINIPIANFTYSAVGLTVNFTNLSTNATTYGWTFGDATFSTLQNPSHTYAAAGTYNVHAAAYNSCGGDTTMIPVTVAPVGITQNSVYADNINVFPNPSDGNIVLQISSEKNQSCYLKVMNLIGQEIFSQKYDATTGVNNFPVNLSNRTNGIYFVKMLMNNKTYTRKIVIQ
jgi:PKD repeat protein